MKELAKKVVQRHLAKRVPVQCVTCGATEEAAMAIEAIELPHEWRTATQTEYFLCSDLCEWRWYHC
jgi:hypothetical protein